MLGDDSLFETVSDALRGLAAGIDAAEAHGVLCGMLSVNAATDFFVWLKAADLELDASDALAMEKARPLRTLWNASREQMQGSEMDLQLLLPDDDDLLEDRIAALGQWARGYLYGLAMAGFQQPEGLPDEAKEFLVDLSEIANVALDVEDSEEDEEAFIELVEYLRMGALMLNETLQPMKSDGTLH